MRPTTQEQTTDEIPKPRRIENEWYVFERRVGSHGKRYRAHIERKPGVSFLVHILPRNRRSLDRIMVWKGLNPNDRDLPKILEDSPQGNSIYVVFPWIPGRLLEEFLEEGRTNLQSPYRMSVEIALQLFNGFAHVLGRLHGKRRIIHGDLHPENLTVGLKMASPFVASVGRESGIFHASQNLMYSLMYISRLFAQQKRTYVAISPFVSRSSGGRIRTSDLRVMSPTSYQAALPRDMFSLYFRRSP